MMVPDMVEGILRSPCGAAGGRKGPVKALSPAKPRVDPGPKPTKKLKAFFWDVLPESRVPGTFWAANVPTHGSLDTQEVLPMPINSLTFGAQQHASMPP